MTQGLHHVTAISGPARRNLDFYTRTLGLRLVKKTVNFDDPGSYHLYYGNDAAGPGSLLTFFPWEHAAPGRAGIGETQETRFRVPEAAIGFWTHRLIAEAVPHEAPVRLFGETVLAFRDPDGMRLALVGVPGIEGEPAAGTDAIPAEAAIRGLHGVSLLLREAGATGAILTDVLASPRPGARAPSCAIARAAGSAVSWTSARRASSFRAAWERGRSITSPSAPPTMRSRRRCGRGWPRPTGCGRPSSRTGTTSARSISASRVACCSRSRPTAPASRSTSRWPISAVG